MRQLLDDFRGQPWVMKLFLLWGWLAVVIMVASFTATVVPELMPEDDQSVQLPEERQVGQATG